MRILKRHYLVSSWLLIGLLALLSGCGSNLNTAGPGSPAGSNPDRLQIKLDSPGPGPGSGQEKPVVTLTNVSMVQQLYTTMYALPLMPEQIACTAELGPHYTLTFYQGQKTLVTTLAEDDGCRQVTLSGEQHARTASGNKDFWDQLASAIYEATPTARVDWLAFMTVPSKWKPPQTARMFSSSDAQHFYDAILALPLITKNNGYPDVPTTDYQLLFHTADQEIASTIDLKQNQVGLLGNNRTRGGIYRIDSQFKQLLTKTLADMTFAPAQPDKLLVRLDTAKSSGNSASVTDMSLIQKLYAKAFTFPVAPPPPESCLGNDKIAGKSKWYTLTFSQWGLNILQLSAYEASCTFVAKDFNSGQSHYLQADSEFWHLLHQAAGSK